MATIPDLVTILNLDAQKSVSPFGGKHRTILISKTYSNTGDFVFNNLLHHFVRKEMTTPILLVTLNHDWSNYSSIAAKCGFNLRRTQNSGTIEVLDMMCEWLNAVKEGDTNFNPCDCIQNYVNSFINLHTPPENVSEENEAVAETQVSTKPLIVMIDDLSILLSIHPNPNEVFRMFSLINKSLRSRSQDITCGKLSHLIVQTMMTSPKDEDLNWRVYSNIENLCDLIMILRPLETGHSTRVDGTIKIIDNRRPTEAEASTKSSPSTGMSSLMSTLRLPSTVIPDGLGDIGTKRALFYKLGDRRVRLTSSALIY